MGRPRNGGERRLQILREATGLFAQYGFDGPSVRTLARACGTRVVGAWATNINGRHSGAAYV